MVWPAALRVCRAFALSVVPLSPLVCCARGLPFPPSASGCLFLAPRAPPRSFSGGPARPRPASFLSSSSLPSVLPLGFFLPLHLPFFRRSSARVPSSLSSPAASAVPLLFPRRLAFLLLPLPLLWGCLPPLPSPPSASRLAFPFPPLPCCPFSRCPSPLGASSCRFRPPGAVPSGPAWSGGCCLSHYRQARLIGEGPQHSI